MTAPADLEFMAGLLAAWGFPPGTTINRAEQGTNNQTFVLRQGGLRFVLRVSQTLSAAQVGAEHRILQRLRQAGLPFQVPEPVAARSGDTVIETAAGPATVCRWIPGVRPDLTGQSALERFGRAAGLLGKAMLGVPPEDGLGDWRGDPLLAHPAIPHVGGLCRQLRAAGISAERAARLDAVARRVGQEWLAGGGVLPTQVIHGDLAAWNVLVDEDSGEVSGLLDFEFAGVGFLVQEVMAALFYSGALEMPDWQPGTAAFLRGYASIRPLDAAEADALPRLLLARAVGSVLWRAGLWLDGKAQLDEVVDRIRKLEDSTRWLDANGGKLRSLAAAGGHG
ncbi:phosphotransferase enzyme family protein [Nonomuraea sp. JJY05]|jgi:homoserine kinase type II|uniref:phosphotransferase enzyme family protein n=1 Tax=Nonomuraea sp. JJY05 TaxID=3350255 RepID=UPI00373E1266